MSLLQFFKIIDNSWIGRFVDRKLDLLKEINPETIYVENIRALYNMPYGMAKFFCEMAVRQGIFIKQFGVYCPNPNDGRMILSVNSYDEIPDVITCETCEMLEEETYEFTRKEVKIMEFYQLNRAMAHG